MATEDLDPHEGEPFGPADVENEAPSRQEHPVGEEAVDVDATDDDLHPLEGGQTDAVDEAQAELGECSEADVESSMSAEAARPGGGEQERASG